MQVLCKYVLSYEYKTHMTFHDFHLFYSALCFLNNIFHLSYVMLYFYNYGLYYNFLLSFFLIHTICKIFVL